MSLTLTNLARLRSDEVNIEPPLVLKIDGLDTVFGSVTILEVALYGGGGLYGDPGLVYGGLVAIDDQADLITLEGSTTSIQQQLNPDKGSGSSISSMQIALVDKDKEASRLISPGITLPDILARKCAVYLGFQGTAYPRDYVTIFRGVIDDVISKAGTVVLNIAHPDQKKRQEIMNKIEVELDGAINNSVTTITLLSTDDLLSPQLGPNGLNDTSLLFYVRIDDELIRYTGISGNDLTGCSRGALNTIAVAHDDEAKGSSFYKLIGDPLTLALKIMLSGWGDYYKTGVDVTAFNVIEASTIIPNVIWFDGINVSEEYGLTVGDYITTTGATNGANNVTLKTINLITILDNGSYIDIDDVSFVDEGASPATISFRSQYDTLGGEQGKNSPGLKMSPDEVDVAEHQKIFRLFLSGAELDFYLKETINGKEFLENEIYLPISCYSIPRKARSSVGYHIGPIPGANIKTLNIDNIKNPSKIQLRRSTNKNFFNTIIYKFDEDQIEDKFTKGVITVNATSKTQIPIGTKALVITSKGLRTTSLGENVATTASNRRLNRYAFGAEFYEQIEVLYGDGFNIEISDIVIFDATNLQITDTDTGNRGGPPKLFEVMNKTLNIKTGDIKLSLVDTNFDGSARYCLVGPSSIIKTGISQTRFVIEDSYASVFGPNEYLKWKRFTEPSVRVHSTDYANTRNATRIITNITGNTVTLDSALGFTPSPGDIMELSYYDTATDQIKLVYGHMSDAAFADGKSTYKML